MNLMQTILIVAGMIVAGLGAYLYLTNRNNQRILTMKVTGTVTKAEEKPVRAKDKKGNTIEGIDHLTYFSYEIDGESYETARITRNRYMPGNSIDLLCNPGNMKQCEEKASVPADGKLAGVGCMLIGMGTITLCLIRYMQI